LFGGRGNSAESSLAASNTRMSSVERCSAFWYCGTDLLPCYSTGIPVLFVRSMNNGHGTIISVKIYKIFESEAEHHWKQGNRHVLRKFKIRRGH